jgi:AAA domain/Bifunctional DNA primase/polymerase, N-terminal
MINPQTELRQLLRRAGYAPLPLYGKRPTFEDWTKRTSISAEEIAQWEISWPDSRNTGILTRNCPACDIDIMVEPAAVAVEELARDRFAERGYFMVRTGQAPKRAILFRTDEPFKKIATPALIAPDGSTDQKVEFLADGQQLVVFGRHPKTGKYYSWIGGEPGNIRLEDLPHISAEVARQFVADATQLLITEHGFKLVKEKTTGNGPDLESASPPADWDELIGNILAGAGLHDSQRDLAASCVAKGYKDVDTANLLRALMRKSAAARDDRWLDRYNDIGELVRSARAKYGEEQGSSAATDLRSTLRAYAPRSFSEIPRRHWLHAGHYIRQQVVMTVAPGGYGKTTLILCNTTEMCTQKGLIGPAPMEGPLRVLYWNAEDPEDEVERRIAAICIHYQIDPTLLGGYLFLGSKISNGERLAKVERKTGEVILNKPLFAAVEQFIADNKIDCVIFDPLIAFHAVPENDNSAMEKLVKAGFEQLATTQNCCVELSQHTRKNTQGELTADDSRGASAITFAARSVRVLNRMSVAEAEMPKIEPEERRHYLRASRDKTNLAPPGKATWVHLIGVELPNGDGGLHGDNVQVATAWDYPQPFAGMSSDDMRFARDLVRDNPNFRADPRSPEWFGIPLAARLKLNPNNKGDRKRISTIIRTWVANKALAIELRRDEKRREREFVVLGPWNDDAAAQDDVDGT